MIVILMVALQIMFACRNTTGSLRFYDTVNYTNLITGNIYSGGLNTIGFMNGYPGTQNGYACQSFYLLASCLYYLVNIICNKLSIDFLYFTQHIWFYSILLYAFVSGMIIDFSRAFKLNKLSAVFVLVFILLFMGNFYWNSEQAYLGNSFRMILISYLFYYLQQYGFHKNNEYLFIIFLFIYGLAGTANSNSTLDLILIFSLFVCQKPNKNRLMFYTSAIYLPMLNILFQLFGSESILFKAASLFIPVVFILFCLFGEKISNVITKFKIQYIIAIAIAILLIVLSFMITGNILNFDAFINNWSGWNDMSWDYTDNATLWRLCGNIIYYFIMLVTIANYKKGSLTTKVMLSTAIIFFNPFAAPVQREYMPVFYRNYDISLNYFTVFFAISCIQELSNKKLSAAITTMMIILSSYAAINQINYHPHTSFIKNEEYDSLLKMDKDEATSLLALKDIYVNRTKENPKIITSIYQTRSEMPMFHTLYSRNNTMHKDASESDKELYKIFYRTDFEGDPYAPQYPDYDRMCEYISESGIDVIVQDRRVNYYDESNDTWYSLTYLIDRCGEYPVYTNDSFAIYNYMD